MSSKYVRDTMLAHLNTELAPVKVVDFKATYQVLEDLFAAEGISPEDQWIGIQFLPADENPVGLSADNTTGYYRETGGMFMHIVSPVKDSAGDDILNLSETVRNLLRGAKVNNDIYMQSVTPPNYEAGGTLQMDGGFTSASVIVNYYRDFSLT
jgi:hypothetical protein